MRICIAQTRPVKGDVSANINNHIALIDAAISNKANAVFFPELSLTGYEPELAKYLATNSYDARLNIFQKMADENEIFIGVGAPTGSASGIQISMIIFQRGKPRQTYSKQQLHKDELPYFVAGGKQILVSVNDKKIAPAICYESLQLNHAENSFIRGAEIYLASVAKSQNGVDRAMIHYPEVAKKYSMAVLMSNCVGYCDNFESVGNSAVWTTQGNLVAQLDDRSEGLLIFDTETEQVITALL